MFAPKRLVDTALASAFLGALDEANRLIAQDPRAAAALYAASSGVGVSHDDVMRMLAAPDTRFSVLPNQLMDYVEFLYLAGTIKAKPRAWHDVRADARRLSIGLMPPRPFIEIPRARALVARSADLTAMQPLHARSLK